MKSGSRICVYPRVHHFCANTTAAGLGPRPTTLKPNLMMVPTYYYTTICIILYFIYAVDFYINEPLIYLLGQTCQWFSLDHYRLFRKISIAYPYAVPPCAFGNATFFNIKYICIKNIRRESNPRISANSGGDNITGSTVGASQQLLRLTFTLL